MLRRGLAGALERGALGGPLASGLGRIWERLAEPVRELRLPRGTRVVGVGGATLGGSGKTPLVVALARELAKTARVAVVASAYSARVPHARVVVPEDSVRLVGDEALWLSRELSPAVTVTVGARREMALSLAAERAELVLIDGLLQTRPLRLACSLLSLDGGEPWGAGHCPPRGDLRAPRERLLAATDAVVMPAGARLAGVRSFHFEARLIGARTPEGRRIAAAELECWRLGVLLAVARPERILGELRAHGITPAHVQLEADHAHFSAPRRAGVDAWLTTPKCATKLGARAGGAPVWVLEREISLDPALTAFVLGPLRGRTDGDFVRQSPPGLEP